MDTRITGCRGKIDRDAFIKKLRHFGEENGIACQIMDAGKIYGREHILSAVEHAVRAFKNKTNSCKTLDLEILLYASGKRQIKDAIEFMGAGESGEFVFVAVGKTGLKGYDGAIPEFDFPEEHGLKIDENVIEGDESILKKFGIGDEEMKTVDKSMYGDLILEKVAMVDIIK
jgi:KEOPS complex subunit Cgi121